MLRKVEYCARPPRFDYQLTAKGSGLLPVLIAMQEFGDRHVMGDGSVSATAAADSPEAQRVHELTGRAVPDLALPADDGSSVALRAAPGWRVLYCFPGAYAPDAQGYPPNWGEVPGAAGCTLESVTYAAHHAQFAEAGGEVLGVSTQRPDQLAAFVAHAKLPFRLLSDQDGALAAGLRLAMFGAAGTDRFKRQSLLIDPAGIIRFAQMPITDPAGSVTEMLTALRQRTA
jgi:peroxiredoxin